MMYPTPHLACEAWPFSQESSTDVQTKECFDRKNKEAFENNGCIYIDQTEAAGSEER
ncbi:hypothetical protein KP79_PYT12438 [Mizuhopecten yessoensis]|uniref:Uncharacterized protein n=1 Tax=Mizuhopecten yessoensis TaxID=6573 RepID=A0A210QJM7_MIZYE|nr:hypothetical protein KP79_PYT12438 [Mizuhopecten yessoensis]